jgi:hypothetical protein
MKTLKSFHYYERYPILVGNEVRLAGFSAGDKGVFIGGGLLPPSLMLLNARHGVDGISVEIIAACGQSSVRQWSAKTSQGFRR